MAVPPIVVATLQSAIIGAFSNLLAQVITTQTSKTPLQISYPPILQFFLFALLSTPPNFLWQEFLETTFPAYHISPTSAAVASASASNEAELDEEAKTGRLVEPKLNKGNTAIKTLLDQTLGAAVNTMLFSLFMHGIRMAMEGGGAGPWGEIRMERVDWGVVMGRARGEFWAILKAGWTFWPWVSLVNFCFLERVESRNLVGSLAGLGWGVYMSLFAGK
ncbi:hypothetical protein QBC34DRAFT_203066 [Podospora aff. communis PSN243]|uniref:Uncharacterized protein n=1 Tax=Podospora aff. communis PSN243 TaxID=3040156 RepID=A0AAV9GZ60_9PEZI|nr:hypothetical protein QBC34DRAFT_203066 [Podospora aff. communis PSN243]